MHEQRLLTLVLAAAGLSGCGVRSEGLGCISVSDPSAGCPEAAEVPLRDAFVPFDCGGDEKVVAVSGEGFVQNVAQIGERMACCYDATILDTQPNQKCIVGRPLREAEVAVRAALVQRPDWGGVNGSAADPARAQAWAAAGLGEHASIAAFSKLAMELLAHGAPAGLVREVHLAGLDEIDHAEQCFAMAGRFGGAAVGPGRFPFTLPIVADRPLADLAADAVREGCVGETSGAVLARAAAEAATDPAVKEVLTAIAEDEERHAALSWQVVAWALRVGGSEVRDAVEAAFREPAPSVDAVELAVRAGVDPDLLRAELRAGLAEVVRPAAEALLAA